MSGAYVKVNCPRCNEEVECLVVPHTVRYDEVLIKTGAIFIGVTAHSARHTCKS